MVVRRARTSRCEPKALPPKPTWAGLSSASALVRSLLVVAFAAGCDQTETLASKGEPAEKAPSVEETSSAANGPVVEASVPPRVALDGSSEPLAVNVVRKGPRVYARHMRVWVREKPSADARRIGYLRAGASSPTSEQPAGRSGCKGGWYSVEPRGFVCVGRRATLDANDPVVRAAEAFPPSTETRLPYMYGTVRNPGPIYTHLPSRKETAEAEPGFENRMKRWFSAGGEIGASYAQHVWTWGDEAPDPREAFEAGRSDPLPSFLRGGGLVPNPTFTPRPKTLVLEQMEPKVGYAFLTTFFHEGRRFGITTQLELMPTDRLRPIQGSDFHGVEIGKDVEFPFAFVRNASARFVDRSGKDLGAAPYRAVLSLSGKQVFIAKRLHYETKDGKYLSDLHGSRLDPAERMPGWAKKGERWIDVNISKQTLVLYEGTKPLFATLIASGEAGLADHETTTATPQGIFRIHTKHITATMASDEVGEEFELRDVPYVQYFKEGYAIHGAYWHDRFGMPKSHGCINLSPEDARRVFHFTEPHVPTGWHGALLPLRGTVVWVHR